MFQLDKTLISEEIFEKEFVCNLNACKGQCCVDGDAGAPLTKEETAILDEIFPQVKPFLRAEGIATIEQHGKWITSEDNETETPLVNGSECAYVVFENDKALCGIEKAYLEGVIDWKKPISCHLYPIRLTEYAQFTALNYHQWHICSPACDFGKELSVPVYKFLKEPLVRKFGKSWYDDLEKIAQEFYK